MVEDNKKCLIHGCDRSSYGHICAEHFNRLFKAAGSPGGMLAQPAYELSGYLTWMEDEYDLQQLDERYQELVRLINKFFPLSLRNLDSKKEN